MISVIILTKNEETDLFKCLKSLTWCDDVHILDSGSTDQTVDIALRYNAKVGTHPFEGFGRQRNYALDNLDIRHDWILFLDADEVVTDKFRVAILQAARHADPDVAGYYCCSKLMLEERWLRYSDTFPKWQFRLLRKGKARYMDFGHGQKEFDVAGKIEYIREPYLHYGISKGWFKWIERHNRYSNLEASLRVHKRPPFKDVFARHPSIRNMALKCWLSKFPGWPFLRFLHAYFFNLGFLEGIPGIIYCINNFYYEFMIQIKMREIKKGYSNPGKILPTTISDHVKV